MNLNELKATLSQHPDAELVFQLPDQESVPAHFHITEVAKRTKNFVDCGGTKRTTETCALQLWVARDLDHRLPAGKLARILTAADEFFSSDELPVEIDHQLSSLTIFTLEKITASDERLIFHLAPIHAQCLAPDKCGVSPDLMPLPEIGVIGSNACTPGSGCC